MVEPRSLVETSLESFFFSRSFFFLLGGFPVLVVPVSAFFSVLVLVLRFLLVLLGRHDLWQVICMDTCTVHDF